MRNFVAVALLSTGLFASSFSWAFAQAVSSPNAKFSFEGGSIEGDGSFLGLGSYSLPLSPTIGLQIDGAIGSIDDEIMGGGGVHLFTRVPTTHLLGVYSSFHTWDDIDIWRVAVEAQLYRDQFSFEALAGLESIEYPDYKNGLAVIQQDDDHFFSYFDVAYYFNDDFRASIGYRYESEKSLASINSEYLIRDAGEPISVFATSRFGDNYTEVQAGIRIYLGEDKNKSLKLRHRTEDPDNYTPIFEPIETASSSSSKPQCVVDEVARIQSSATPITSLAQWNELEPCTCNPPLSFNTGVSGASCGILD